jgi:hypothetical protein
MVTALQNAIPAVYQGAPAEVTRAVRLASARSGVDFAYLMAKASAESGLDADAKATTSTATGLFQFTEGTWLSMVREHGAKYGLGRYAEKLDSGAADSAMRREILGLRRDPQLSAYMAAEYANDNKAYLADKVGGKVGASELYLAHFLGPGGASKFLNAMKQNESQPAAALFQSAAQANRSIFYEGARPRSLAEVFDRLAAKVAGQGFGPAQPSSRAAPRFQPAPASIAPAGPWRPLATDARLMLAALPPPAAARAA